MTKEEILKLHTLSEYEQYEHLEENGILKGEHIQADGNLGCESLADCAFRMRDEWNNKNPHGNFEWFLKCCFPATRPYHEKPIHWIQSALLAKLESEDK